MEKQIRIVMTNALCSPSREEISGNERALGEAYFKEFPLEWAGWIVQEDTFNLSAQWLCPFEHLDHIVQHVELTDGIADRLLNITIVDDEEAEEQKITFA